MFIALLYHVSFCYSDFYVNSGAQDRLIIVMHHNADNFMSADLRVGGIVALSVEYRTCEREVVGSSLGRARGVETLGKFLTPVCLCSPSSTSWYRPKGGDALRLGSKGRYGLCVGGR